MADRALIVLDPRQTETARAAAEAKLKVARAAQRKAKLEADLAIQTAAREAGLAEERIRVAEGAVKAARLEGERSVRAALEQQELAEFDVKVASERAQRLNAELTAARAKLGVQVPADEVVFIPSLPIRVHEVTAAVAANASGPVMSVTDNQLSIDSQLPLEAAPLVKPGMKVAIDEQALGIKATGIVETVANTPGTRGVDGYHFYLGVKVETTPVLLAGFFRPADNPDRNIEGRGHRGPDQRGVACRRRNIARAGRSRRQAGIRHRAAGAFDGRLCRGQHPRWATCARSTRGGGL